MTGSADLLRRAAVKLRAEVGLFTAEANPRVALALADWLEGAADDFEVGRVLGGFQPRSMAGAMATARAILREPEEKP